MSTTQGEGKIKYVFKRTINLEMLYCTFEGASLQFEELDRIGVAQF